MEMDEWKRNEMFSSILNDCGSCLKSKRAGLLVGIFAFMGLFFYPCLGSADYPSTISRSYGAGKGAKRWRSALQWNTLRCHK